MAYSIEIAPSAKREWKKLDPKLKQQFQKKLATLLHNPKIPSAKLSGHADAYRIKARAAGYRLIYRVIEDRLVIMIVAVGKRDASKGDIYASLAPRLRNDDA